MYDSSSYLSNSRKDIFNEKNYNIFTQYYDPRKAESFIHADKSRVDNLHLTQIAKLFTSVNERGAFFGEM